MSARGPYAKTEARKTAILDTAVAAFSAHGFQGASLREIAEAVGLSQAGVLHHFGSKEVLLAAVLARRDEMATSLFTGTRGIDVLDALRQVMASNVEQRPLVLLYTTLSAESISEDHPAHDYFTARYVTARALIASALGEAKRDGDLRPDVDVELAAGVLLATMDGLQLQWLLDAGFDMVSAFDLFLAGYRSSVTC